MRQHYPYPVWGACPRISSPSGQVFPHCRAFYYSKLGVHSRRWRLIALQPSQAPAAMVLRGPISPQDGGLGAPIPQGHKAGRKRPPPFGRLRHSGRAASRPTFFFGYAVSEQQRPAWRWLGLRHGKPRRKAGPSPACVPLRGPHPATAMLRAALRATRLRRLQRRGRCFSLPAAHRFCGSACGLPNWRAIKLPATIWQPSVWRYRRKFFGADCVGMLMRPAAATKLNYLKYLKK